MSELIPLTVYGPSDGKNYQYGWRGDFLEAQLLSDVGKKRQNNEDSCLMCAPESPDLARERGLLFAVADGMGGASAGEHASRMALQMLAHHYYSAFGVSAPLALRDALDQANGRIFEEAAINPLYSGMGTTVSAMIVIGHWAYIAQVGDSRVYLHRDTLGLQQLTRDHSLVAEQVRNGIISEEEARNHSLRNLITRAVGIKDRVKIDLFSLRLQQGDTLLICSDGLSNMVVDQQIANDMAMSDLQAATRKLVIDALEGGGSDNITTVTVRVTGEPPHRDLEEGAEQIRIARPSLIKKLRGLFS